MAGFTKQIIVAGVLILAFSGGAVVYNKTRGYRNNNPGNIRHSNDKWVGQSAVQNDKSFVQFDSPEFGIRALGKVLMSYETRHGLNTIQGIISRWAPPTENITSSYVASVAKSVGVGADEKISVKEKLFALTKAIIKHENGVVLYDDALIAAGLKMV